MNFITFFTKSSFHTQFWGYVSTILFLTCLLYIAFFDPDFSLLFFWQHLFANLLFGKSKFFEKKCLFCWDLVCISFLKISCFPFVFVGFPSVCLHFDCCVFRNLLTESTFDLRPCLCRVVVCRSSRRGVAVGPPTTFPRTGPRVPWTTSYFLCARVQRVLRDVLTTGNISCATENTYTFFEKDVLHYLLKLVFFSQSFFWYISSLSNYRFLASPFSCHCFFFSQLFFTLQSKHSFLQLLGLWHRLKKIPPNMAQKNERIWKYCSKKS